MSDSKTVTDGIPDREDCARCNGSGQVTDMVAGRSGLKPCPDCDNVPEYALPDNVPEDPVARIEEIDDELEELKAERQAYRECMDRIGEAADRLNGAAKADVLPDEDATKLGFIAGQISQVMHGLQRDQGFRYQRRRLREEKRKLETLVKELEHGRWEADE